MFLDALTPAQMVERLQLALEGAALGVWDWSLVDDSVQFDRRWCEMLGLEHAATPMNLETWRSRVHPEDLPACERDIAAHLEGRTTQYENVHRMRHANGEWVFILDRGRVSARDASGKPTRFTGTHLDVTASEQVRRRELLENRLLALGLAAGGIAHDLVAPLQAITLAADEALAELAAPTPDHAALNELLTAIARTTRRAADITNGLRTISRGSTAPLPEVDLSCVLEDVQTLTRARFHRPRTRLELEGEVRGLRVRASGSELSQVLLNLVNNALLAIGEEGVVRLVVSATAERVTVKCVDSGPGVAPEHRARIMEPFFTTRPDRGGTGLGLAVSQQLARKNHGSLNYEPEAPQTTFTLTLERA